MTNPKSLKENAIMNVFYTIINIIFPLIAYPYVVRTLSVIEFGKVSFFLSISSYAIMISSLGISTYGIRAIAKVRDDEEELSRVAVELLVINLVNTIVTTTVLLFVSLFASKFKEEPLLVIINILNILVAPLGVNWLYSGLEQYNYITKRNLFFKVMSLILIFTVVKGNGDYLKYASLLSFSAVGTYLCNFLYARKFVKFPIKGKLVFKTHLQSMLVLFASILAVSVYTSLDTIMLGFINGEKEVGYYSIASKIKWILLSLINAISVVLLPRLSNYVSNNKMDQYYKVLKMSISFVFLITIPISVYFWIEAADSIFLLGGMEYESAIRCMQFLMPILLISGFSNVIGNQILIPKGQDSYFMRAVIVGAIVDVILNALLMPTFASAGAAVATLIAELVQMSIQFYYAKDMIFRSINTRSVINTLCSGCIAGAVTIMLREMVDLDFFLKLVITAIIYGGIYILILMVLKEECVKAAWNGLKGKKGDI